MQSPPKPWERASPPSSSSSLLSSSSSASPLLSSPSPSSPLSSSSSSPSSLPPVPNRPGIASGANSSPFGSSSSFSSSPYGSSPYGSSAYGSSAYGSSPYGSSAYGSAYGSSAYGSSYGSPYGSSAYGSSYGSSYGSPYGSSYGGGYSSPYNRFGSSYGSSYGGYGGYGMNNRPGFPGQFGMQNNNFMQQVEQGSQQTFGALNALVQAVGGFAQMLESTFFASHSSFMAIMGLVEQFGVLRDYLGHALSMVALYRFARNLFYKMTGRVPPANVGDLNPAKFEEFQQAAGSSKKPLLIFLAILVGIPLLLSTLMKKTKQKPFEIGPDGRPVLPTGERPEVARALYPFAGQNQMEIAFKPGDEIHVLSRTDPRGSPVEWWKGYTVDPNAQGPLRVGMFPGNYVEITMGNPEVPPRPNQVLQNRGQMTQGVSNSTRMAPWEAQQLQQQQQQFQQPAGNPLLGDFDKEADFQ